MTKAKIQNNLNDTHKKGLPQAWTQGLEPPGFIDSGYATIYETTFTTLTPP